MFKVRYRSKHPPILWALHVFNTFSDEQWKSSHGFELGFYLIHTCIKKYNNSSKTVNNKHLKKRGQESCQVKDYLLCFSSVHCHTKCKIVFISFLDKYERGSYQSTPCPAQFKFRLLRYLISFLELLFYNFCLIWFLHLCLVRIP